MSRDPTISYASPRPYSHVMLWVILAIIGGAILLVALMLLVLGMFWFARPAVRVRAAPAVPVVPAAPVIPGPAPEAAPVSATAAATEPSAK